MISPSCPFSAWTARFSGKRRIFFPSSLHTIAASSSKGIYTSMVPPTRRCISVRSSLISINSGCFIGLIYSTFNLFFHRIYLSFSATFLLLVYFIALHSLIIPFDKNFVIVPLCSANYTVDNRGYPEDHLPQLTGSVNSLSSLVGARYPLGIDYVPNKIALALDKIQLFKYFSDFHSTHIQKIPMLPSSG